MQQHPYQRECELAQRILRSRIFQPPYPEGSTCETDLREYYELVRIRENNTMPRPLLPSPVTWVNLGTNTLLNVARALYICNSGPRASIVTFDNDDEVIFGATPGQILNRIITAEKAKENSRG